MIEIVGHGAIACALGRAKEIGILNTSIDRIFFAAGVSNPNETSLDQYYRELVLLLKQDKSPQIVYFSSLGVLTQNERMYFQHKRAVEKIILANFPSYAIAQLGILVEADKAKMKNPHTTINFLRGCVRAGTSFNLRDVTRNVIEEGEFIEQINELPNHNCIVKINGKVMTETEMYNKYVKT